MEVEVVEEVEVVSMLVVDKVDDREVGEEVVVVVVGEDGEEDMDRK